MLGLQMGTITSRFLHEFQESESQLFGLHSKHFHPLFCSNKDTNRLGLRAPTPTVVGTHLTWLQLQRDPFPSKVTESEDTEIFERIQPNL